MKKTLLAAITLISASSTFAADSVDLKVGGTIAPVGCFPTLSGGGAIDYGDIKVDTLRPDSYTALSKKSIALTITCDGMTKLSLKAINNRSGTIGEGAGGQLESKNNTGASSPNPSDGTNSTVVGLGMDGSNKIGSYFMAFDGPTVTVDGHAMSLISYSKGVGWTTTGASYFYDRFDPVDVSWGTLMATKPGNPTFGSPSAFKTMTSNISVQAYIAKASSLDLTKPLTLDGSTTIELVYL
ncbi:DUF1120 domain-containing protein [Pseudomonas lundensis]|uniref:DUF1120 domain-containing protein n=1 Tax=Serratia proteamaculans TaxID=28151 RepID=UPI002981B30D|nr:DUF1120 domain-containing protein [Serratia proteamaculans]MDW5498649.1 DUF1120 domain-containing protein [Serratia proteamaculans]MDW5503707.1 DUF1120 domain-containing protein [Pseudomonas lundensis]